MTASPRGRAVVAVSCTPVRAEPSHRAEMVSQWLCGESLELLGVGGERDEWVRGRGPDGYEGWAEEGGLLRVSGEEWDAWRRGAVGRSLGTAVPRSDPRTDGRSDGLSRPLPAALPWGARVRMGRDGHVRIPTGERVLPEDPDRILGVGQRRRRFPRRGDAIVETASEWRGVPYLWGGRTRAGTDCSGLAQAVFAMHGIDLPRDSGDQLAAGPEVSEARRDPGSREPGDLLFFGRRRDAITHVAISAGGSETVHAASGNGAVAMDDLDVDGPVTRRLSKSLLAVTRPLDGSS